MDVTRSFKLQSNKQRVRHMVVWHSFMGNIHLWTNAISINASRKYFGQFKEWLSNGKLKITLRDFFINFNYLNFSCIYFLLKGKTICLSSKYLWRNHFKMLACRTKKASNIHTTNLLLWNFIHVKYHLQKNIWNN